MTIAPIDFNPAISAGLTREERSARKAFLAANTRREIELSRVMAPSSHMGGDGDWKLQHQLEHGARLAPHMPPAVKLFGIGARCKAMKLHERGWNIQAIMAEFAGYEGAPVTEQQWAKVCAGG